MKSLQAKMVGMLLGMLLITLILSFFLFSSAREKGGMAEKYHMMNELAGNLNATAGWQAIERGVGATILGSDNPSTGLLSKFKNLGAKGDAEVQKAMEWSDKVIETYDDGDFKAQYQLWKSAYDAVRSLRSGVLEQTIKRSQWIPVAGKNIENEFLLRSLAFDAKTDVERVVIYNTVVRANVATLAEYAGRERAILGGIIASGKPISDTAMKTLGGYRALVENASKQILSIKNLNTTPQSLSSAISDYEKEFLGPYQQLRKKVYAASVAGSQYPVDAGSWIGQATKAITRLWRSRALSESLPARLPLTLIPKPVWLTI